MGAVCAASYGKVRSEGLTERPYQEPKESRKGSVFQCIAGWCTNARNGTSRAGDGLEDRRGGSARFEAVRGCVSISGNLMSSCRIRSVR